MSNKSNVFVIMPFQEEFFEMYEMLKIEFSEKYEFTNAGDEGNQQNILNRVIQFNTHTLVGFCYIHAKVGKKRFKFGELAFDLGIVILTAFAFA